MARNPIFSLTAAVIACAMSTASFVRTTFERIADLCVYAKEAIISFASAAIEAVATKTADLIAQVTPLVQARAYVMRLAKRERPELTGSWRLCPST